MRLLIGSLIVVGAVGVASAATTRYFSGTDCLSSEPPDDDLIARYNTGCRNTKLSPTYPSCETPMTVILPITGNLSDTVNYDGANVSYYDGNTSYSISCTLAVVTSGTTYASAQKTSSNGSGTLTWSVAGDLPNSSGNISGALVQHIYCDIPSKYVPSGSTCVASGSSPNTSDILGYNVTTVNP
jgi:hypothetical protein